jgi:predicted enzyme related to lactoylglutathione lyase
MSNSPGISAVGITAVGQIHINAVDLERATAFYRDVLGLQHLFSAGSMAFFGCGEVRLMLGVAEKPEFAHASSILYFKVADIDAAHAALVQRQVAFEHAPSLVHRAEDHDLWMAFFRDSEDNVMALMSEVAR